LVLVELEQQVLLTAVMALIQVLAQFPQQVEAVAHTTFQLHVLELETMAVLVVAAVDLSRAQEQETVEQETLEDILQ
jgi:hypothetical protein